MSKSEDIEELPMEGLPPAGHQLAKHGDFTGESVESEVGKLIIDWFKGGVSISQIATKVGMSRNTVTAYLRNNHGLSVEQMRQQLGVSGMLASQLVVNRVIDEVERMPTANLALAAKLMSDIGASMTGSAPVVIEHNHRVSVEPTTLVDRLAAIKSSLGMGLERAGICPISAQPEPVEMEAEILPKSEVVAAHHPLKPVNPTN